MLLPLLVREDEERLWVLNRRQRRKTQKLFSCPYLEPLYISAHFCVFCGSIFSNFMCIFIFVFLVLSVGDKNLDVGILGYGIEAGTELLPFRRCVFAPDAAVSHYICVGEFLAKDAEQLAQ